MYRIDEKDNSITALEKRSFSELGFKERDNLQEWIAKDPTVLGEELLIIQKEFDGFDETRERLDLLALDRDGSLVIIENKLDDTGRDVTWQAIKYASYCSSLSKENIKNIFQGYLNKFEPNTSAEDRLIDFYDVDDFEEIELNKGITQRIILVAANFRKEVTSTVFWLMNYKIRLQCFKATPYSMGSELFLNVEQIIPTKDAEDYMIGMADKAHEEMEVQTGRTQRQLLYKDFWRKLLDKFNTKSDLLKRRSPGVKPYLGTSSGVRGISLGFYVTNTHYHTSIYIDRGDKEENELIFNKLLSYKSSIENTFGHVLEWQKLETKRACRIKYETSGDISDRSQWNKMIDCMAINLIELESAARPYIEKIGEEL